MKRIFSIRNRSVLCRRTDTRFQGVLKRWASVRPWTFAPVTGGGERLAYILFFALQVAGRMPQISGEGRFWAEEGRIFFENAWNLPWSEALIVSYGGYLNICANLARGPRAAFRTLVDRTLCQHCFCSSYPMYSRCSDCHQSSAMVATADCLHCRPVAHCYSTVFCGGLANFNSQPVSSGAGERASFYRCLRAGGWLRSDVLSHLESPQLSVAPRRGCSLHCLRSALRSISSRSSVNCRPCSFLRRCCSSWCFSLDPCPDAKSALPHPCLARYRSRQTYYFALRFPALDRRWKSVRELHRKPARLAIVGGGIDICGCDLRSTFAFPRSTNIPASVRGCDRSQRLYRRHWPEGRLAASSERRAVCLHPASFAGVGAPGLGHYPSAPHTPAGANRRGVAHCGWII